MFRYTIEPDIEKNRLYIKLAGFFTDEALKEAADRSIEEASKLGTGFDIINDISELKPASEKGYAEIKRAQAFMQKNGVNRVIRITGSSYLSSAQFSQKTTEVSYSGETAKNKEEAELMLES